MTRAWFEVAANIRVCQARRYTTSSSVVSHKGQALLVDPALEPSELLDLAADLAAAQLQVQAGVATHAHYDHLLWHPDFGGAPRWASRPAVSTALEHRVELLEQLGAVPDWMAASFGLVQGLEGAESGSTAPVDWSGPEAVLVIHDAHSPGHAAVWLPAARVLLAGDMLSDLELPLPGETGLAAYDTGLALLRPFVEQAEVLVPGHGHPTSDPMARWTSDRRYLDAVLDGGDPADPRRAEPGMEEAHQATLALRSGA